MLQAIMHHKRVFVGSLEGYFVSPKLCRDIFLLAVLHLAANVSGRFDCVSTQGVEAYICCHFGVALCFSALVISIIGSSPPGEYIDDTEDLINIQLDYSRNKLIRFDILLTAGTFALAFFNIVSGLK